MAKRIVTETDVVQASASGSPISAPPGECLVTPQARDKALELGVVIIEGVAGSASASAPGEVSQGAASGREEAVIGEVLGMMQSRLPDNVDSAVLEAMVRDVIRARRAGGATRPAEDASLASSGAAGVRIIDNQRLVSSEQGLAPVPGKVIMAEALGSVGQPGLSAGYMQWEKASFSRLVECEEVCIVVEGRLHLTVGGETLIANSGDMVYLPEGINVLYSAPERVKLACVNCAA